MSTGTFPGTECESYSVIIVFKIAIEAIFDVGIHFELITRGALCKLTCSLCGTLIKKLRFGGSFCIEIRSPCRELDCGNSARKLDSDRLQVTRSCIGCQFRLDDKFQAEGLIQASGVVFLIVLTFLFLWHLPSLRKPSSCTTLDQVITMQLRLSCLLFLGHGISRCYGQWFPGSFALEDLGLSDGCLAAVNVTVDKCPGWLPNYVAQG